jgi:hypothetical protein
VSKRKKAAIDAIAGEMGAVAGFAGSGPAVPHIASTEINGQTVLAGLLLAPSPALAQERRSLVGGKYEVAVGWDAEPPIEGQKNAASIRIVRVDTSPAQPVERAEETLRVRIRHGAETREFPLRTVFGQRGYYLAHFVPTRVGDYEFTFVGTVDGDPVDEAFDSAAGRFGRVEPVADLELPVRLGGPAQLAAAVREAELGPQNGRVLTAAGLGIGFLVVMALLTSWRARSGRSAAISTESSREQGQERAHLADGGPFLPPAGEVGALRSLGEDFRRGLRAEIGHALQPVMANFRQEMAHALRERAEQAFRPAGGASTNS